MRTSNTNSSSSSGISSSGMRMSASSHRSTSARTTTTASSSSGLCHSRLGLVALLFMMLALMFLPVVEATGTCSQIIALVQGWIDYIVNDLLLPLTSHPTVQQWSETIAEFWAERTTLEKCVVGGVLFFIFAGFTGLDGGKPKNWGPRRTVDEVSDSNNTRVYFDISINDQPTGRIVMELFDNVVPQTAANFKCLCTGEMGKSTISDKELHFKGSSFHRIIPGFMCQGGDFTKGNGTGGESIYGARFNDEFDRGHVEHSVPGLLSSANRGPDTNGSQFFLTTAKTSWLDRKHVVFGRVEDGMNVVTAMEKVGTPSGSPAAKVVIVDCGTCIVKPKSN